MSANTSYLRLLIAAILALGVLASDDEVTLDCTSVECHSGLSLSGVIPLATKVCYQNGTCGCECCPLTTADFGGMCRVTSQCSTLSAQCLDSNGVILDHLTEEEAKEVVDANSTAILNPSASEYGICVCAVTHRHDPKVDTCVPRAEGTVCKSTYACTVKLPMSRCVTGQCKCAPDTKYDAMTDRCNFEDKMAADVDVVCFFEDHCLTMRAASGLGFFLSAMLISLIAMCLCACARQCRSKGHRHERLIDRHIDFSSIFDDKPRDKYEGNFGVGRSSDYTMDGAQDGRY